MEAEKEKILKALEERLETHDENRKAIQNRLHESCDRLRTRIDELEEEINKELEEKFASEDKRLQEILNELRENSTASTLQKAKRELLVVQSYEIIEDDEFGIGIKSPCKLKTGACLVPKFMWLNPTNVRVTNANGSISLKFTCFNPDEERALSKHTFGDLISYKCLLFKKGNEQEGKEYYLGKGKNDDDGSSSFVFTPEVLEDRTTYGIRVKMVVGGRESEWSDEITEFTTPEFKECCMWKKCPDGVKKRKYSVDVGNPRFATSLNYDGYCTIIGDTHIPLNTVLSWNVNILKSWNNDGRNIYIGIAPNDINQDEWNNYDRCGWYFNCYWSTLWSGPPHNYRNKDYGLRKGDGQYVHTGDSVGVVMDTTTGVLSFIPNVVNLGIAYCGIPLDKPLVPCVLLGCQDDSVELDTSEAKENVDSSVPAPSNITAKSITWDSITLTWDEDVDASFYQIEVDGNKTLVTLTANSFTKKEFLPETECSFRVRTIRGNSVSKWSDVVKGRTLKESFETGAWKDCLGDIDENRKYIVDEKNPRVATKISGGYNGSYCTIIGNTHIPLSTVTPWSVKILKSWNNNGSDIYIGVAPNDINQNKDNHDNFIFKCGWYFDCYWSKLRSGPPHNYRAKEYGPRKWFTRYVHNGDSVGVVMDTTKGDLSFVLNGMDLGIAYEGIPLDKPLVPCVFLGFRGNSVELVPN